MKRKDSRGEGRDELVGFWNFAVAEYWTIYTRGRWRAYSTLKWSDARALPPLPRGLPALG